MHLGIVERGVCPIALSSIMFNGMAFFVKGERFHDGSLTDTISFSLFIGCGSMCYSALQQKAQQACSGLLLLCEVLGRIQTCSYVFPLLNVGEIYAFTAQNFKRVKAVEKYQSAQVSRNCWIPVFTLPDRYSMHLRPHNFRRHLQIFAFCHCRLFAKTPCELLKFKCFSLVIHQEKNGLNIFQFTNKKIY